MIRLDKFQKHIVLYCKGQYDVPKGDKGFFEGLKMIWAIRCGYDYEQCSSDVLSFIANDMFDIINQCMPYKLPVLIKNIHREINTQWFYKPLNMTPIETIVWKHRSILLNMPIRERKGKRLYWIVDLRHPQPRLFNRILKGKGAYNDYYKIKWKNK